MAGDSSNHKKHRHDEGHGSSSSKRSRRDDNERDKDGHRHRHRSDKSSSSSSKHRSSHRRDKGDDDDDEWVEKEAAAPSVAASLLQAPATDTMAPPPKDSYGTFSVGEMRASTLGGVGLTTAEEMTDGYGEGENGSSKTSEALGDLFSNMGTEQKRRQPKEKVDPTVSRRVVERVRFTAYQCFQQQMMGQSSRELNKAHWQGVPNPVAPSSSAAPPGGSPAPGSSGSTWRMSKLRRTYETAEEEGRPVEEVALERYTTLDAFREAIEERRVLDERDDRRRGRRSDVGGSGLRSRTETPTNEGRRFVFTDSAAGGPGSAEISRPGSRGSFRRPGEQPPTLARTSSSASDTGSPRPQTPVPSVFTPPPARTPRLNSGLSKQMLLDPDPTSTSSGTSDAKAGPPPLSQSELNKLQARVLKARLMGADASEIQELEKKYETERVRALEAGPSMPAGADMADARLGGDESNVRVLPTLDGRGRLYDIGTGAGEPEEDQADTSGRKRKKKDKVSRMRVQGRCS